MIHKFSVQNFYSIGEEIQVNFEATPNKLESPELYHESAFGKPVTKIAFFGGKNASGKTNTLRALAFIGYMMSAASIRPTEQYLPFVPCIITSGPKGDKPTVISVTFSINTQSAYTYKIMLTRNRILEEELKVSAFKNQRISALTIFSRSWQAEKERYEVNIAQNASITKMIQEKKRIADDNPRSSLIVMLGGYDVRQGIFRKIIEYWSKVYNNVMKFGSIESELSLTQYAEQTLQRIYGDEELNRSVSEILRRFDIGFNKIHKQDWNNLGEGKTEYSLLHVYDNAGYNLGIQLESNGTKRMIVLLRYIVAALRHGGVAVMDELDAFLHPDIFDYIVDLFMSKRTNPKNAQLIFSAHNYTVLGRLEKQQIFLSDRNENGETEVWRLDDMKGIRTDENYYTHYLANCYGGKPILGE